MSASLLQKSLKLIEDNKELKKKNLKKKKLQNCKWRAAQSLTERKEKHTKENIQKNIKQLVELDTSVSLEISEKIFSRKYRIEKGDSTKKEEKTVFTEKDFEEFEKEYFAS